MQKVNNANYGCTIGLTEAGRPVIAPEFTRKGDLINVAPRARAPFVLRPTGVPNGMRRFPLLGTGYLHKLQGDPHLAVSRGPLEKVVIW